MRGFVDPRAHTAQRIARLMHRISLAVGYTLALLVLVIAGRTFTRVGTASGQNAGDGLRFLRDSVQKGDVQTRFQWLGRFRASYYQIVDEREPSFAGKRRGTAVRDERGRTLTWVSKEFHRRMCIEGCGRLADGRVLTFATRVDGEVRFRFTDAPHGLSHRETPLVPFRSVAVDAEVIPLGSVLYVPCFEGVRLPDSSRHDGFFVADDVGSSVRGRHVDFFVGFEDHIHNTFSRSRSASWTDAIDVYLVSEESADGPTFGEGIAQNADRTGDRNRR